jgi:LCP family protein required for cell wall assembly
MPETDTRTANSAARERRPRRSNGTRAALIIVVGIVLLLAAGVVGTAMIFQGRINAGIERFEDPFAGLTNRPAVPEDIAGDGNPVNILFLGSDARIDVGDPDGWADAAGLTDAIMLAQVSGDRQHVNLMSIPRDSWVEVPGHGMHKINSAFALGGPSKTIETVENLTGVRIDHIAVANFESFAAMTDELGGVEVYLPNGMDTLLYEKDEDGQFKEIALPAGEHLLSGDEALAYARQRHGVPGGDFGRVQRQQNWMRQIMQAAYRENLLTNPAGLASFLQTVGKTVAVDEGFTIGKMRDLALSMRDIRPPDVVYMTVPHNGTGTSPDGQSIVMLDEAGLGALAQSFVDDNVADYLEANPDAVVKLDEEPA